MDRWSRRSAFTVSHRFNLHIIQQSDLRNCVMFQGPTGGETQETKAERRSSENDDDSGEAFLIFSVEISFELENVNFLFVW